MHSATVYIEDVPGGKKITIRKPKGKTLSDGEIVQVVAAIKEHLAKQNTPDGVQHVRGRYESRLQEHIQYTTNTEVWQMLVEEFKRLFETLTLDEQLDVIARLEQIAKAEA